MRKYLGMITQDFIKINITIRDFILQSISTSLRADTVTT